MTIELQLLKFVHILSVVFMSAPLYNLIVVGERARFGPMSYKLDRYLENLIKGSSTRCYIYQLTALGTGLLLVGLSSSGVASILTNWVLAAKTGLLLGLMGLLSYVHFGIQPKIEKLLAPLSEDPISEEVAAAIKPLRLRRKRLAGLCLFLVIVIIVLGLQVYVRYHPALTLGLLALAALFSWRVYKKPVPYGWV
jgi:hypothetical protein